MGVVNLRYETQRSTIVTTNRGLLDGGEICGDTIVAAAILYRLRHDAVVFKIKDADAYENTRSSPQQPPTPPRGGAANLPRNTPTARPRLSLIANRCPRDKPSDQRMIEERCSARIGRQQPLIGLHSGRGWRGPSRGRRRARPTLWSPESKPVSSLEYWRG